jgi:hypothetical protein
VSRWVVGLCRPTVSAPTYPKGIDFADALHLCTSAGDDEFKAFDKRFARKAASIGLSPTVSVV